MTVYLVVQEAVYMHDLIGVFDSLDGAIGAANAVAGADVDNYHEYNVLPFDLNTPYTEDPRPLYTTSLWAQANQATCDHKFDWSRCKKCGAEKDFQKPA